MKAYHFDGKPNEDYKEIPIPDELKDAVEIRCEVLFEALSHFDEDFFMKYAEGVELKVAEIIIVIRKATIADKFFPVLCGSALKNKGVKLMLNTVIDYLPSPLDVTAIKGILPATSKGAESHPSDEESFSALALKIITDTFHGRLTFYEERDGRILQMHANSRAEIKKVYTRDIGAIGGLKDTSTGDILCDETHEVILEKMSSEPVISLPLAPKTKADEGKMCLGLLKTVEKDPTFRVSSDKETGQTIISGMAELHLDISIDHLERELKVRTNVGNPQATYMKQIKRHVITLRHPVESSERASNIGTSKSLEDNKDTLKPVLLKPIMNIKVIIPDEYHGSIVDKYRIKEYTLIISMEETKMAEKHLLTGPKQKFERSKPHVNIGRIVHVGHGKRHYLLQLLVIVQNKDMFKDYASIDAAQKKEHLILLLIQLTLSAAQMDGSVLVVSATDGPMPQTRDDTPIIRGSARGTLDGKKESKRVVVTGFEMFRKLLDEAQAGSVTPCTKFEDEVYILTDQEGRRHISYNLGYRPKFYFCRTDVTGSMEDFINEGEWSELTMLGDYVTTTVGLILPVASEKVSAGYGYPPRTKIIKTEMSEVGTLVMSKRVVVTGFEMFRKLLDEAQAGSVTPCTKFEDEVYILTDQEGRRHISYNLGYRPKFYFCRTDVTGSMEDFINEGEWSELTMLGDYVTTTVGLILPVASEKVFAGYGYPPRTKIIKTEMSEVGTLVISWPTEVAWERGMIGKEYLGMEEDRMNDSNKGARARAAQPVAAFNMFQESLRIFKLASKNVPPSIIVASGCLSSTGDAMGINNDFNYAYVIPTIISGASELIQNLLHAETSYDTEMQGTTFTNEQARLINDSESNYGNDEMSEVPLSYGNASLT
uniref:Elongation factor G n=1 Tax=Eufriesea mexicana TaxID=516756 RepID=A0A310SAT6_9HYME